jgi:hypothetical protein
MTTENSTPIKPVATPDKKAIKPVVKTVAKPATKTAAKPKAAAVAVAASKSQPLAKTVAKPAAKAAVVKDIKAKKPKMVRDSFTFPKDEYTVMDALKLRAAKLGHPVKKTELLRAGIKAITAMTDTALLSALKAVPSLKTGRPAKN